MIEQGVRLAGSIGIAKGVRYALFRNVYVESNVPIWCDLVHVGVEFGRRRVAEDKVVLVHVQPAVVALHVAALKATSAIRMAHASTLRPGIPVTLHSRSRT